MGEEANACPACGYDLTGVSAAACPECGVDVAAERARLAAEHDRVAAEGNRPAPRRRMAWVLVLLLAGAFLWTLIAQAPLALAAETPYDPFRSPVAWFIWGVLVLQWAALLSCLVFVRKLSRASAATHGVLMTVAVVQALLPMLLICLVAVG